MTNWMCKESDWRSNDSIIEKMFLLLWLSLGATYDQARFTAGLCVRIGHHDEAAVELAKRLNQTWSYDDFIVPLDTTNLQKGQNQHQPPFQKINLPHLPNKDIHLCSLIVCGELQTVLCIRFTIWLACHWFTMRCYFRLHASNPRFGFHD